ncbi:MAG: PHP domain-containing protein [Verrucomicrobia bacterium]|nr:PHP domain-containing protein [Verrucomicrobiota bacterium]
MSFRADLHTHTDCSDGTVSPQELVRLAKQIGLSGLAITDHDTFEGYFHALPVAEKEGIELLIGAEFSAAHPRGSVHILAYGFDPEHIALRELCAHHLKRRTKRNLEILERLKGYGMSLNEEDLWAMAQREDKKVFGRPHIAQAMVKLGYASDLKEAFSRWIGDGKPAYAAPMEVSVEETLERIHLAKGFAVIAHPHLLGDSYLLSLLLKMPFDGIEGFYGKFAAGVDQRYVNMGQNLGWIITGGSDFHGSVKPQVSLGSSWVGEGVFRKLQGGLCREN